MHQEMIFFFFLTYQGMARVNLTDSHVNLSVGRELKVPQQIKPKKLILQIKKGDIRMTTYN